MLERRSECERGKYFIHNNQLVIILYIGRSIKLSNNINALDYLLCSSCDS